MFEYDNLIYRYQLELDKFIEDEFDAIKKDIKSLPISVDDVKKNKDLTQFEKYVDINYKKRSQLIETANKIESTIVKQLDQKRKNVYTRLWKSKYIMFKASAEAITKFKDTQFAKALAQVEAFIYVTSVTKKSKGIFKKIFGKFTKIVSFIKNIVKNFIAKFNSELKNYTTVEVREEDDNADDNADKQPEKKSILKIAKEKIIQIGKRILKILIKIADKLSVIYKRFYNIVKPLLTKIYNFWYETIPVTVGKIISRLGLKNSVVMPVIEMILKTGWATFGFKLVSMVLGLNNPIVAILTIIPSITAKLDRVKDLTEGVQMVKFIGSAAEEMDKAFKELDFDNMT